MIFGQEIIDKAQNNLKKLTHNKLKISFAESCTGGLISTIITEIPNASKIFELSLITYSNQSKIKLLNIDPNIIKKYGAVSANCAQEMAKGLIKYNYCNIAISITGIAGPNSDNTNKNIGLVYICLIYNDKIITNKLQLGNLTRSEIRIKTAIAVLNMISDIIDSNSLQ